MIIQWAGYALLWTALLSLFGACAESLIAGRQFPRRMLWLATMLASATLPAVVSFAAQPRVIAATFGAGASSPASDTSGASVSLLGWNQVAVVAWVISSLAVAAWLVFVHLHLQRSLRVARPSDVDGLAAVVSPEFGPAVVGVLRPRVVVPEWVLLLPVADRRPILLHELEHKEARDPLTQLAALCLVVACPWNPALWWQLQRLRLAIELDCDARVVRRHKLDPVHYGEVLLSARAITPPSLVSVLALVEHRSVLGRRIDALVARKRASLAATLGAMCGSTGVIAALALIPAPAMRTRIRLEPTKANEPAVVATATATPTRGAQATRTAVAGTVERSGTTASVRSSRATRVLPSTVPPARIIPSSEEPAIASPTVAPLPVQRMGRAMLVRAAPIPRRSELDSTAAAGGIMGARAGGAPRAVVRPPTP